MAGTILSVGDRARRGVRRGGTVTFSDIIGRSQSMERVIRLARKAAASTIPILIEGETGVGKELVARAIHGAGERRSRPFVTVNCGSIADDLIGSTLSEHREVTGAIERQPGKFVEARSGTLFLDGIADLLPDVQEKLLGAVAEGEIGPVGGRATVRAGVRLISATHRNLIEEVRDGKFREDLYYRLNVFPIFVPPLRDRPSDIPGLVRHFMSRVATGRNRAPRINAISEGALSMLQAHDWPGNVRQLESAVLRAVTLCRGDVLTEEDFPQIRTQVQGDFDLGGSTAGTGNGGADGAALPARGGAAGHPATKGARTLGWLRALDECGNPRALADIEADMIRLAVYHCRGRMSEVARRLGIGRSTLYRKLEEHGIASGEGRF